MREKTNGPFRRGNFIYYVIALYSFVALFANLLANEKPLYVSVQGRTYFPAFNNNPYIDLPDESGKIKKQRTNNIDWKNIPADIKIFPPVCWSPVRSDLVNSYSSPFSKQYYEVGREIKEIPFRFRHFLGTGKTGNDVLAGLIHGLRTSLAIGFFSATISLLIGIFLGGIAGYFGDDKLKTSRGCLLLSLFLIIPAWFYSFHIHSESIINAFEHSMIMGILNTLFYLFIFILILLMPNLLRFNPATFPGKKINLPTDTFISRLIEIFTSLPRLILILTIAAITGPSVISIIMIIGITSWTETARLMRAQVLQLRETNFIAAAKTMGNNSVKIIIHHLIPNALSQIFVVWIFGIASAILIETGLSFLGIGVPAGTSTWGGLMFEAKENYHAWWLVVFTGLAIFSLLSSLYMLSNKIKLLVNKFGFIY